MARSKGTMKISSNIEPRLGAPLDARLVVPTLADLTTSGNFPYPYVGMLVSVQATKKLYMYNGGTITSSSSWNEVGGNTLSGTIGGTSTPVYVNSGSVTAITAKFLTANNIGETALTDNQDLNDFVDFGVYGTSGGNTGSSVAQSLANKPTFAGGFRLYVESCGGDGSYAKQTIITKGGRTFTRTSISRTEHTWNAWREITGLSGTLVDGHIIVADGTTGSVKDSGFTIAKSVPSDAKFTDTTYTSKSAASEGTDVSLVTTGEKYTWGSKADGNHTHSTSLATDSGTATVSLTANTTYKLTAGGTSVIFKTPADSNTTYTSKSAASGGTDVSLVTTGEKYTWGSKADGNHTHTTSLATDSGTATVSLTANTTYKLSAGGTSVIFKTPADSNTTYTSKSAASGGTDVSLVTTGEKYTWNSKAAGNHTHTATIAADSGDSDLDLVGEGKYKLTMGGSSVVFTLPSIPSYSSKAAASGGTDVSLVTTGEKYTWGSKAAGNHTHTTTLATDSGTASVTLSANTTYKLSAGGTSVIFKTPADSNTTYSSKAAASGGTDVSLVTTGEKYTWNNKAAGDHTHSTTLATDSGTASVTLAANTTYKLSAGGTSVIFKTPADNNTTYSSKAAASGGTDVSLVTTGEKYTWNSKAAGDHTHSTYVPLAGGTMTGLLKLQASVYTDSRSSGALDLQNSNIIGVNAIYMADASDNAGEAINWVNSSTTLDSLWASGGVLLFTPNRADGTATTAANSQKVGRFTANPTTGQVVITDGTNGGIKSSGYTIAKSVPSDAVFTDTTYSSKSAASGGTDVSLVTTGEKYTWNNKAAGNHTHTTSLASDSGTSSITLAHGGKYKLTAGGTSVIFTMPTDNNTTYSGATGSTLGLIRISASGDVLSIYTSAS